MKQKGDDENKEKTAKGKKGGGAKHLILTFAALAGVIFVPTTIVLCAGMVPTVVAFFVDRSRKKTKTITVGAMNLAGCSPFLLEMWVKEHTVGQAISIVSDPKSIVVMFSAATIGYMIDWSVTGMVSNILYQKGLARIETVSKRLDELVERWGQEVTGEGPFDDHGFLIVKEEKKIPVKSPEDKSVRR